MEAQLAVLSSMAVIAECCWLISSSLTKNADPVTGRITLRLRGGSTHGKPQVCVCARTTAHVCDRPTDRPSVRPFVHASRCDSVAAVPTVSPMFARVCVCVCA